MLFRFQVFVAAGRTEMKRILLIFSCLIGLAPSAAKAQERGEVSTFGGYLFSPGLDASSHGWNVSIARNTIKHLALVADLSGFSSSYMGMSGNKYEHGNFSLLIGPRVVTGKGVTPFVQALLGLHCRNKNVTGYPLAYNYSSRKNGFVLGLGTGFDIRVSNRISIRPLQLDFIAGVSKGIVYGRALFGAVIHLNGASRQ
jgi:hypothetical protein